MHFLPRSPWHSESSIHIYCVCHRSLPMSSLRRCTGSSSSSSSRSSPANFSKQPRKPITACVAPSSARQHCTQPQCSNQQLPQPEVELSLSRRQALLAGTAAAAAAQLLPPSQQQAAQAADTAFQLAEAATTSSSGLQLYENSAQQYRMQVPVAWERKEKAGADVLFEDPEQRSTSVGVTVSPVRVANIGQFGDLQAVGQRLLDAERKKESTMAVELLASSQRQGSKGATLYDYEYELDSTRGKKRIFNTVTITDSKLYILNGNFKCDKEAGCSSRDATAPIALLRQVAASFDAGSGSNS